jgi:hypothetical protein
MLDPATPYAPVINQQTGHGRDMQLLSDVGRTCATKVHSERTAQAFIIIRRQAKVLFEPSINVWIAQVIDRYAVGLLMRESPPHALFGLQAIKRWIID